MYLQPTFRQEELVCSKDLPPSASAAIALNVSAAVTSKNAQLGIAVPDGMLSGYLDDQVRTRTLGTIDKDTDFAT